MKWVTLTLASVVIKDLVIGAVDPVTATLACVVLLHGDFDARGFVICSSAEGLHCTGLRFYCFADWQALHGVVGAEET